MVLYFLKTIILLGLFYAVYMALLKQLKTFSWNRTYLLLTSLLTMLLPFLQSISISGAKPADTGTKPVTVMLDTIHVYAESVSKTEINYAKIVLAIYLVGVLWGVLRIILGFIVIRRIKQNSRLEKVAKELVYFNRQIELPFSFNGDIFIPDGMRNHPSLEAILMHENAHIQKHHTRDKIYFSILQALFWFNPFIYFYHKELELIHEFEADTYSTQSMDVDNYVDTILQTVNYTNTPTLLVHHFFNHPLKTRIIMLYKKSKNTTVQKLSAIVLMTIIGIAAFYIQSEAQKRSSSHKYTISQPRIDTVIMETPSGEMQTVVVKTKADTIYETADVMPEFYGGEKEMMKFIVDNLVYPEEAIRKKIEGRIQVTFTVTNEGDIIRVKAVRVPSNGALLAMEAERCVSKMPKWKPGSIKGKKVPVNFSLPITFSLK